MTAAPDAQLLAAAVSALAGTSTQPEVRTQLHALAGILPNVVPQPVDEAERERLRRALADAVAAGDEAAAVPAMRALAALERSRVRPVDFSLASRG